ncbi:hypothetical protein EDD17DRAFT_1885367 [Pisolithus thermaeus]|nr:hypothetical protein EDD17DRAFT_1885367 [Pisolithus thermaeus]
MSKSSLSSVVSNLVRASMGASVPASVQDEDLDRHVAELILKEAKQKAESYTKLGVQAYLPAGPDLNAPRANKRFLSSIIRRTDDHNKSILREQALAAQEIKRAREEEERRERRARAEEAASAERSRRRRGQRDSSDWRWDGRTAKERRDIRDWSSDWRKQEDGDSEYEHGRDRRERRRRRRREDDGSEDEYRREKAEGRRSRRRRDDDDDGMEEHGRDEEPRRRRRRSRSRSIEHDRDRRRKKTRRHTPSRDRDSRDGGSNRREHTSEKHRHHNDKELEYRRLRRRKSSHPHSPSPAGSAEPLDGKGSPTGAQSPLPKPPPQAPLSGCEVPPNLTQGNTASLSSSPETPPDDHPVDVRRTAKGKEKEIGPTNFFVPRRSSSPPLPPPQPSPPPRRKRGLPSSSTSVRSPSVSPPPLPPTALPSKMDKYFDDSYDPRLDVSSLAVPSVPKTGLINDADYAGWDAMLEFLRQRREDKEEKKRLERLGFPSREIKLEHLKKRNAGESSGGDSLMGIEYKKRGSVREWDLGKEGV